MLGMAFLLSACTPHQLLNGVVIGGDYALTAGVPFGSLPRQKADIYKPTNVPAGQTAPVLVFFYGGRWQAYNKEDYRFAGEAFSAKGWLVIVPDTRLWPEVVFPDFVTDAAKATAWAYAHAAAYGGDPKRLHIMGHSSGAHIAAMVAFDQRFMEKEGAPRTAIRSFVGLAGPYDFLPFTDADVQQLMGPKAGWADTQPINFVDAGDPPALLLHGAQDDIAQPGNTTRMAAAIAKAGGRGEAVLYPELDHYEILVALAKPFRWLAPVRDAADAFMRSITP